MNLDRLNRRPIVLAIAGPLEACYEEGVLIAGTELFPSKEQPE